MSQQLQEQVLAVQQAVQNDLMQGQNLVYSHIVENQLMATIGEHDFVTYFLPCFAGMVNPPNWIVNWIQISGAPTAEVSVVSRDGQELYRIPPLLASSKVFLVNRAGSLGDIFRHQELIKNSITTNPTAVLFHQLDAKSKEIQQTQSEMIKQRWDAIFARYNIVFQSTAQTAAPVSETDIFDYE